MAPRGSTNPAPKTESAREARKSFYCEPCSKGYGRMNEFEAHQSSYDHQHKKRLKDMKQMQRDPLATARARKAEQRADEKAGLISFKPVKLDGGAGAGGFKKGGFKSAFKAVGEVKMEDIDSENDVFRGEQDQSMSQGASDEKDTTSYAKSEPMADQESDTEDEGYEMYDPRRPTD